MLLADYILLFAALIGASAAAGAGRAFPIKSENYVITQFQNVNPNIEWDPSNDLVDKAGLYANCKAIGEAHTFATEEDGVTGVRDYTDGSHADTDAVHEYISTIIDNWMATDKYRNFITTAKVFGCSVRPGCSDQAVVACLFKPGYGVGPDNLEEEEQGEEPQPDVQYAYAFTPEQYELTEKFTGNAWDRSHFLENLSGYETQCTMLDFEPGQWRFSTAIKIAQERGYTVYGVSDYSKNLGSTDEALEEIIKNLNLKSAKEIGCSIIPDCYKNNQMYVVASCIYLEE